MDSKNQFTYFCLCIAVGFIGGVLYEPFSAFRKLFQCHKGKNKGVGIGLDIGFCISFALLSIYLSFLLKFPDFRGYMVVGYGIGMAIYLKILHYIVAFFEKVCYNMIKKRIKERKTTLKEEENGT